VVNTILVINKGDCPSCDDLFDDNHTLVHETLIYLNALTYFVPSGSKGIFILEH
jgi:hypothetical protein